MSEALEVFVTVLMYAGWVLFAIMMFLIVHDSLTKLTVAYHTWRYKRKSGLRNGSDEGNIT